jgi:hypothetical protein
VLYFYFILFYFTPGPHRCSEYLACFFLSRPCYFCNKQKVAGTRARSDALAHAAKHHLVTSITKNVQAAAAALLLNYANALKDPSMPPGAVFPPSALFFDAAASALSSAAAAASSASDTASNEATLATCLQVKLRLRRTEGGGAARC